MEGNYYNNILASFMFTYLDLIFWCTFPYINHIFFQELECIIYVFHNVYMFSTLTALSFNDDDQQIPPFMMTIRIILTFLFGKETKVDLLNSSTFVEAEFVSPEHMKHEGVLQTLILWCPQSEKFPFPCMQGCSQRPREPLSLSHREVINFCQNSPQIKVTH